MAVRGLLLIYGFSSYSPNSVFLFHRFGGFHAFLFKPQICAGFKVTKVASLSYSPDTFTIDLTDLRASQVSYVVVLGHSIRSDSATPWTVA